MSRHGGNFFFIAVQLIYIDFINLHAKNEITKSKQGLKLCLNSQSQSRSRLTDCSAPDRMEILSVSN